MEILQIESMIEIIFLVIILAISIGLHEYAHAIASFKLGDPTPKLQGRLTPNPLAHIDILGFLMIFIINFGWGKPVQVNPMYYKNKVKDELIVALAGPFTNIILSILGILILIVYSKYVSNTAYDMVLHFWYIFSFVNISLAVFNMLPLPPFDGFRLIKFFLPRLAENIEKYTLQIAIVFILIIALPQTSSFVGGFINTVTTMIFKFLYLIISGFF